MSFIIQRRMMICNMMRRRKSRRRRKQRKSRWKRKKERRSKRFVFELCSTQQSYLRFNKNTYKSRNTPQTTNSFSRLNPLLKQFFSSQQDSCLILFNKMCSTLSCHYLPSICINFQTFPSMSNKTSLLAINSENLNVCKYDENG